jgi:hypothetical protein
MQIKISFDLGVNQYWKDKLTKNAQKAAELMSTSAFIEAVRSHDSFDFCDENPTAVAIKLSNTDTVEVTLGVYSKLFTRAIAYEAETADGHTAVFFNSRKESYGAGSPGNIAHEVMHALGYRHNGNAANGNENTVPYFVGNLVDEMAS